MGRKKSLCLPYDPPERCQVRFGSCTLVGMWELCPCVCVWAVRREGWVATWCFDMLKKGIHEARATQTPGPRICEGIHLPICTHAVCAYMPPACTQTHTCPSPACSPPTLFLSHYLTPIKYDWITQESHHQPVYSDSCFCRGSTFLVRSYSISLLSGFHTSAPLSSRFLIFFSSFFLFYEVVLQS